MRAFLAEKVKRPKGIYPAISNIQKSHIFLILIVEISNDIEYINIPIWNIETSQI
jgi:hypothetical protein